MILSRRGWLLYSKTARQMTKAVNPENQALWQLPDLYSFLCEWAYEVDDMARRGSEFHFARYHMEDEFQYADGQNSYLMEQESDWVLVQKKE